MRLFALVTLFAFGFLLNTACVRAAPGPADEPIAEKIGCSKGLCWKYCNTDSAIQGQWCYLENTRWVSGDYQKCETVEDCAISLSCASRCSLI